MVKTNPIYDFSKIMLQSLLAVNCYYIILDVGVFLEWICFATAAVLYFQLMKGMHSCAF